MLGNSTLLRIILAFCLVEILLYYLTYGNSGGDIAFQIFSLIFLVFFGTILWMVSKPWAINIELVITGILISAILLFLALSII